MRGRKCLKNRKKVNRKGEIGKKCITLGAKTGIKTMTKYNLFTLGNGLRVVHNYEPTSAMVAVDTLYNVGSRDERRDLTGIAHLFEHLMFGGSEHIPDFDAEMERAGGMNNACTSSDFTNFYDIAPAVNLDTLLWLESDRMLAPSLTERVLETQRAVVMEEFKETCLNQPYGDFSHRLHALLYREHPYRVPTIGADLEHIRRITIEDVRTFFATHYAPNNAVLAISGNVTLDECREAVEKWYGEIPSREIAPRLYQPESEITEPRSETVHGDVPCAMVVRAYPMCAHGEAGFAEADLLTDILASGRSSRYFRRLMTNPIFAEADASIAGSDEAGFLMLRARLAEGAEEHAQEAVELLTAEAMRLCETASAEHPDGVTRQEVERAVNRFKSNYTFNLLNVAARADRLAHAVMQREDINEVPKVYEGVTAESIAREAEKILDPRKACTLYYLPKA